jgi:osmotically-inducible protein OsmY
MHKIKSFLIFGNWVSILLFAAGVQISLSPPLYAAITEKKITDAGITVAVEDGLILNRGVFPNDVDVDTRQSIVTLSGSVDNLLAKERILQIAESVRGVLGVIDRLTVTPVSRTDADICKDIQEALKQDPATESYQIIVSVKDGVATLTGSVGSYMEKKLAARAAEDVRGTKDVRNDIVINYAAKRSDREIAADIKDRLQWDIWINGETVNSSVKDGLVTLTGPVGSVISKLRAYEDAWVNGVKSVDNSRMTIDPWVYDYARKKLKYVNLSDDTIKKAVLEAFRFDPRVSAFSPNVAVDGGVVYLSGTVGNLKAKTFAEQDAKNIVSVWQVDNFIHVRPKQQLADSEMKTQLTKSLSRDPLLDGDTINATVTNQIADLSGTVGSNFRKIEAQDVASRTKGVVSIRNHLKVEKDGSSASYNLPDDPTYDWFYKDRSSYDLPYYPTYDWLYKDGSSYKISGVLGPQPNLSDEQIAKKIEDGFFWEPYVDKDAVKVDVEGGVATLTGKVGTWIGWNEINKDAYNGGATKVVNRVRIDKGAWLWE